MKKLLVIIAGMLLLSASPAAALFTNGGFEDGNFDGWTLEYGQVDSGPSVDWGTGPHSKWQVIDASATMPGQTLDVNPYNGNYMARINDSAGDYHATRISQTDQISQQDIDDGATIYVNWGAMLIEPTNTVPHSLTQPFFGIEISIGGSVVDSFMADATAHGSDATWVLAGSSPPGWSAGDLWYKQQTWSYDISAYAVGTDVSIAMFVADCGLGGHGGYAFLDGIGTTYEPPNPVPEPATMLLLGLGLVGLGGVRFKFRK